MAVNCSSYPVFPGGRPPGEWKTVGKGAAETVFLPYACRKAREIYGRRGHAQGFTSLLQVLSGQGDFSLDVLGLRFRERGFPDGGRFRGGGLLRSGVDGFQNQFHRAFQAVVGRVDAQVVEAGVAQLLPGIVQAVGTAAGIHEVHGFGC